MTSEELREEIGIELDSMEATVNEALSLYHDLANNEPTIREKTAAAAFIAQFYGRIENILKRIFDGTVLGFSSDGTASAKLVAGVMTLGGATVSTSVPTTLAPTLQK